MNGVLALARAVAGTPLEELDLAHVEPRYVDIVRRCAGQNGQAAEILRDWTRGLPDGDAILRAVCAQTPGGETTPQEAADPAQAGERPPSRFRLLSAKEVQQLPAPTPLIEGLLYEETLSALYGPEATFKSFTALDWHLCIGLGLPWCGRRTKQGATVYVSAEGSRGLGRRIEAWERAYAHEAAAWCHFLTDAPQLLDDGEVDDLLSVLEVLAPAPVLVTLDTVARTMVGGDENSSRDMGRYVAAADRIKRALGCAVNLIHHSARAGGNIRGSTSLPAALDTEIRAERDQDVLTLTCDKQKDAEEFLPIIMAKRVVQLSDGGSSVVLEATSASEEFSQAERLVLSILVDTFGARGATDSQWREVCESQKVSRPSYYRAKKKQIERGLVLPESNKRGALFLPSPEALAESQGIGKVS